MTSLSKVIGKYTEDATAAIKALENEDFGDLEFVDPDAQIPHSETNQPDVDDAPVVKFIHKVLLDAINGGASDVHFEPYEKFYRIRYRVDGQLKEIAQPPVAVERKDRLPDQGYFPVGYF
jgi:type IV pilus assembly protein PilB